MHLPSSEFALRPWVFFGVVALCQLAAFLGLNVLGFALAEHVGARIVETPLGIAFELVIRVLGFPLFEIAQLNYFSLVPFVQLAAVNAIIWAIAALLVLRGCRKRGP